MASLATVAVVGCGAGGLVAIKNLLEEGFDVVGFDQNDYVGGLWHYTSDAKVSCMETTIVNVSRERACFTDFPFPEGTSSFPPAAQVDKYLNHYCDNFDLRPKLRLGTTVERAEWDESQSVWRLSVASKQARETLSFDKLVVATGPYQIPRTPKLPNRERFEGRFIHSMQFKNPTEFCGKNVMVVGLGNTAADIATGLVNLSAKVYLGHRHGVYLLPRILNDGSSLDHSASYRMFAINDALEAAFPKLSAAFMDNFLRKTQDSHFKLDPAWRMNNPTPSIKKQLPIVSDGLFEALRAGQIAVTHVPRHVVGPREIELEDGTKLNDIDAIIYCTGYRIDLSFMGKHDPTLVNLGNTTEHNYEAPLLYRNIISHSHPDTLAFIGYAAVFFPAFLVADLASMALAQLWKHPEQLPTKQEMQRQFAKHQAWRSSIKARPNVTGKGPVPLMSESGEWLRWVQEVAGTMLNEHLSYTSLTAWKFWWQDRRLCNLLSHGLYTPHMYRLFDSHGKRKKWDGAKNAIIQVNEDVKTRKKAGQL